jgi:hypothetical protein
LRYALQLIFDYDIPTLMISTKRQIISLFTVLILSLTSCTSKRTNIIIGGHYFGVDSKNQSFSCDLFIKQISENEFFNENGKNVIKDAINNNYFSVEFIVNFSENDAQQIDFFNFKDAYNGATGTPISYVDDNDCWLTPFTSENNEILPELECYYSVNLNISGFELFVYLYAMEG